MLQALLVTFDCCALWVRCAMPLIAVNQPQHEFPCAVVLQALLVNFDCCALWVRDAEPLKAALSLTPEFLRARGNTLDYKASLMLRDGSRVSSTAESSGGT